MFDGINLSDYIIGNYKIEFELQQAYFLRDCLEEEISYELRDSNIIIYKKLDNGISEEISLDELIFYIHTDVAEEIRKYIRLPRTNQYGHVVCSPPSGAQVYFKDLFKDIDNIKKAVENMKIILKYDDCDESDSENESEPEDENSECDEKNTDHESLAF